MAQTPAGKKTLPEIWNDAPGCSDGRNEWLWNQIVCNEHKMQVSLIPGQVCVSTAVSQLKAVSLGSLVLQLLVLQGKKH